MKEEIAVSKREMTEEELEFIQDTLASKNVSVSINNDNAISVSKKKETSVEKQIKKARRKKRTYIQLMRTTIIIPVVLSIIVLLISASFLSFAQGNVALMFEQLSSVAQTSDIISNSNMQSLETAVTLYDNRWIIIATICTFFGIISFIMYILYLGAKEDLAKKLKDKNNED